MSYKTPLVNSANNLVHQFWTTGTSFTGTFNFTPTQGDVLIAVIASRLSNGLISVLSVSQPNVNWTFIGSNTTGGGAGSNNCEIEIWLGVALANPGTLVTVNLNTTPNASVLNAIDVGGIANINFLDQLVEADRFGLEAGPTPITTTPIQIWVGGIVNEDTSFVMGSPTNNFTLLDGTNDPNGWIDSCLVYYVANAVGIADCMITMSGGTPGVGAGVMATFRATAITQQFYGDGLTSYIC
jgi:hypothetical protein